MVSGLHAALTPINAAVVTERPADAGPGAGVSVGARDDAAAAATYGITARRLRLARERPDGVVVVVGGGCRRRRPRGAQMDLLVRSDGLPEYGVAVE